MSWINPLHLENKANLAKQYKQATPFAHFVVDDFLAKEKISTVAKGILTEQFHEKYSDLFHMYQTNELNFSENPNIKEFIQFVKDELIPFMQEISGLNLDLEKFDAQGAIYADGNYLLCHDDQLEGRAIAFLLYLSDHKETDGGKLHLYDSVHDKPVLTNGTTVMPKSNRFACFTVSKKSFHEVSEVLADTQRVSVGGWLHHGRAQ